MKFSGFRFQVSAQPLAAIVQSDRRRNIAVDSTSATLHFVGWVEPTLGYVGFRFTLPNLHIVNSFVQSETQLILWQNLI